MEELQRAAVCPMSLCRGETNAEREEKKNAEDTSGKAASGEMEREE